MSLMEKYRRWRGADEARKIEHVEPRYHYEVIHLNGEVSEEEGNRHQRDEGFALIYEADRTTWARITIEKYNDTTCKPGFGGFRGYDVVRELEGIQEIKKEKIGQDVFTLTYNDVKKSLDGVEKEFVPL